MEDIIKNQAKIIIAKENIKFAKRKAHNKLYEEYKHFFIFLDIMVVMIILMSAGAMITTTIIVEEKQYQTGNPPEYFEVNKLLAETTNMKTVEDLGLDPSELQQSKTRLYMFMMAAIFFAAYWSLMLFVYIWYRMRIYTHLQMGNMLFAVCFLFTFLGWDFYHDLGLYLAKLLFG